MQIFVEEILKDRFDLNKGIFKIEEKLSSDPGAFTNTHLTAYRICRAAAMVVWMEQLKIAVVRLLKSRSRYERDQWSEERAFWVEMKEQDWSTIRAMLMVIRDHQIWIQKENPQVISAISSTRQREWREILLDGRLPGRSERLFQPLNDTVIYDAALR
jgi:hypothetical protein